MRCRNIPAVITPLHDDRRHGCLQAVATDRLAHGLFQRRLQRRSTASAAQAWQEAYHAALEDVKSAVAAGRSSIACKWHWPPPESRDPGRVHHPGSWPAVWWQEQASDDLSGALEAAALPSLQHTTGTPQPLYISCVYIDASSLLVCRCLLRLLGHRRGYGLQLRVLLSVIRVAYGIKALSALTKTLWKLAEALL